MKRIIAILLTLVLLTVPLTAYAKPVDRYTTQTVKLREKSTAKSKTIYKVKANTKVSLLKTGKTWARIKYKGKNLSVEKKYLHKTQAKNVYPGKKFKRRGRARWNGCSWTWHSQRVLPGRGLKIPGRHVDKKRGFVLDKDGYICLASGRNNKKKRAIVPTPFGMYGKVYDTNGRNNNKWFDVYCNW